MSRSSKNAYLSRQHIKDEQINFLLGGVEKKLEEYRNALEQKENNFQTQKKIPVSAKQSYDKTVAENKELKAYIESLKRSFINQQQQQRAQFLEQQKNYYQQKKSIPKKYKMVVFEEESESEPEIEQEEDEVFENEFEKEPEPKKISKRKSVASSSNIFDYINKNAKRHKQ